MKNKGFIVEDLVVLIALIIIGVPIVVFISLLTIRVFIPSEDKKDETYKTGAVVCYLGVKGKVTYSYSYSYEVKVVLSNGQTINISPKLLDQCVDM